MTFWTALGFAIFFLVATIAILATKFMFPHHRRAAFFVYGVGWLPLVYSISLKQDVVFQYQAAATALLNPFWEHVIITATMLVSLYIILVIFPFARSPLLRLSNEQIERQLAEDRTLIKYLDSRLTVAFSGAEREGLFAIDFANITSAEKSALKEFWTSFIEVMIELDLLKEKYKTFYQLRMGGRNGLHKLAFSNGYAAFLAQHFYSLKLVKQVTNNSLLTFLNEAVTEQGIEKDTFNRIRGKLTNSKEVLRLSTGRAYYRFIKEEEGALNKLIRQYTDEIDASLTKYAKLYADKPLSYIERKAFSIWFPVQKRSALGISYIRASRRQYHIAPKQVASYANKLVPGDILLQRREWHATNVGIPGFWTHSALFVGDLAYLDDYFGALLQLQGQRFSEYLAAAFPEAYVKYKEKGAAGFPYSVIESKRQGVVFESLEESARADSLAVLRVRNLSKEDHFMIITAALQHIGKPYDYDFNFVTDHALVCSELIYKSYLDIPQLTITPHEFNGRPIFSPNEFAEKFAAEYTTTSSELELVLFLDGNERSRRAIERDELAFMESWRRPKWHIARDFVRA